MRAVLCLMCLLLGMLLGIMAFDCLRTEETFNKGWNASQHNPMNLNSHQYFTLQKNKIDPTTNKTTGE